MLQGLGKRNPDTPQAHSVSNTGPCKPGVYIYVCVSYQWGGGGWGGSTSRSVVFIAPSFPTFPPNVLPTKFFVHTGIYHVRDPPLCASAGRGGISGEQFFSPGIRCLFFRGNMVRLFVRSFVFSWKCESFVCLFICSFVRSFGSTPPPSPPRPQPRAAA